MAFKKLLISICTFKDVLMLKVIQASNNNQNKSRVHHEVAGEKCCVCLSRLKDGEDSRVLPCLHEFHRECVDRWLNGARRTCPVCRFSMEDGKKLCLITEDLTEEMVIWFSSFHVAGF
ncbi:hypothetical protein R3W88_006227 [Solanum pinnatisectum]|uniref:RING-type E3 ubiquitin transferase n=3 Tax=Solanum TaxID=4107 RepID=A0ABQ7VR35_SOLTU|nr:hypothetical protein KY285_014387 [Solanum tuberosum]KAH0770966.1 hypothetical protein KY290_014947 [Solanum tuberosum]KAK4711714.1 hypothetical protein R3W88_006227 [Solanum pinnatisectum]